MSTLVNILKDNITLTLGFSIREKHASSHGTSQNLDSSQDKVRCFLLCVKKFLGNSVSASFFVVSKFWIISFSNINKRALKRACDMILLLFQENLQEHFCFGVTDIRKPVEESGRPSRRQIPQSKWEIMLTWITKQWLWLKDVAIFEIHF